MKTVKDMSMEELGAYICSSLEKEGIDTVLSGGCCVEIYSHGRYTSDDIDLIDRFNGGHRKIKTVMEKIGFKEHKMKRYFVHKETFMFIEFPRGPLGVGDAPVREIAQRKSETGILKLLTPTDCIKDRLAGYYHWDDEQNLEQAIWVAMDNEFDMLSIKKWSIAEGMVDKFEIFRNRVELC
ncbi:hypothetical protein MNB_SV-14-1390 [hydrothermal vent metagenome]|uniref:Uncharacterized protein n=1 Tax=hydrothermal vent metagenome TaxID=652676 RepID=A0A1W1CQC4_9ZZZZ